MINTFFYHTEIGEIGIADNGSSIIKVYFANDIDRGKISLNETPLIQKAAKQINEYLTGKRQEFDLPLAPKGTEFQANVWKALQTIPYGETRSYKQIARQVGSPLAYRAVGMANNKNPIFLMIPCHRVIGASGKLVGYGGGIGIKQTLLDIEKNR